MHLLHRFLTHPATILCAVALGFVVGFRLPGFSQSLRPIPEIYVVLLERTIFGEANGIIAHEGAWSFELSSAR